MITRVVLQNFRAHRHTELSFRKGVNVLVGIMGSGKSTVIDAIVFGLFGTFPALSTGRVKLEQLIRTGETTASVEVTFVVADVTYTVARKLSKSRTMTTHTAELRKEGKLVESPSPTRVTEHIERVLSVDYDLFTRAIYSEQNNIDYFLTLRKGKRKQEIDALLGLDRFDTVRTNAGTVLHRIKQMKAENEKLLARIDEKTLDTQVQTAQETLERIRTQRAEKEGERARIAQKYKEAKEKRDSLERLRHEAEKLDLELRRLEGKREALMADLSGVDDAALKNDETTYRALLEETEAMRRNVEKEEKEESHALIQEERQAATLQSQLTLAKQQAALREQLQKQLDELNLSEKTAQHTEKKKEYDALMHESATIKAESEQISHAIEQLRTVKGVTCPVCDTPLTEEKRKTLLEEKEAQRQAYHLRYKTIEEKRRNLEREISQLEAAIAKGQTLTAQLHALPISSIQETTRALEQAVQRCETLRNRVNELRLTLTRTLQKEQELKQQLEKLEIIRKKQELLHAVNEDIARVKQLRARVNFDPSSYTAAQEEYEKVHRTLSAIEQECRVLEREEAHAHEVLEIYRKQQAHVQHLKEKIARWATHEEEITRFMNALTETQRILREEYIDAINTAMDNIFSAVYPYRDYSAIQLAITEDDYELQLERDGTFVSLDAVASGGERACAAMALRIALATVLTPNLSWLILDEPTHNLDSNAIRAFLHMLQNTITTVVSQVFVITHDERLQEGAHALFLFSRNKDAQEPTKVERYWSEE